MNSQSTPALRHYIHNATFIHNLPKKFRRDPLFSNVSTNTHTTTLFLSLFFSPLFFSSLAPDSRCGRHISAHFGQWSPFPPQWSPFPPQWSSVFPPSLFSLLQDKIPLTHSLHAVFPFPPHAMAYHVTLFCEVVVALKRAVGVMMRRWWLLVAAGADRPRAHTPTS